jgi:hypothetical protein
VTLLASQPSLSMLTLTTERMRSPGSPTRPTVEMILRSSSADSFRVAFGSLARNRRIMASSASVALPLMWKQYCQGEEALPCKPR